MKDQNNISSIVEALKLNNVEAIVVNNGKNALAKIIELIPQNATVMNGASKTLEQIGFVDYLKSGEHGWNNLHEKIVAETDPAKQAVLRKHATFSDYYLGSVHALTEDGEFIIASNTGSQLSSIVFTSPNLIFVVSIKKIVKDLDAAMKRLNEVVLPLEDENMKKKYGVGTSVNKIVIFKRENPMMGRSVKMILIEEDLGF